MQATNTQTLMPDLISQALATDGLGWLVLTMTVAGIVRGFTGFGTGMIFAPIGFLFLEVTDVVLLLAITGFASTAALLPKAVRDGDIKEVSKLGIAAIITVPFGIWLITLFTPDAIRWLACFIAGGLVVALLLGWRYRGPITTPRLFAIGGAAGVFGGLTGLTGPAVIMFYLANGSRAVVVRANTILFLATLDIALAANLFAKDLIRAEIVGLALVLSVPYFLTSLIGQRLFRPDYEQIYRLAAYGIIAASVVIGLPLWD